MSEPEGGSPPEVARVASDAQTARSDGAPAGMSNAVTMALGSAIHEPTAGPARSGRPRALPVPPERYVLGKHLAAGGQGDVYRVFDRQLRRDMVMKVLGDWWTDDPGRRA